MKNRNILLIMALLTLTACGGVSTTSSDIASLYTGYEYGSWYKVSKSCSAKLCDSF